MATLFIDADACPVTRDALALARKARVPVVVAGNTTQNLERHVRPDDPRSPMEANGGFWVETLAVGVGADAADFAIAERLEPGDIVVTQDIGLASMALGRGAAAIACAGMFTAKRPSTCSCLFGTRKRKCDARGAAPRDPLPSPMRIASASATTYAGCCR